MKSLEARRTPSKSHSYRLLADLYDDVFGGSRAPVDRLRDAILGEDVLPQVISACDLGCGTGTTAVDLAKRGIEMFAVDQSPCMCRQATAKARKAGVAMQVLVGDMRSFRLPHPVDLVISEGDAVNHIGHRGDLARVAKAVWRALRPGGYFYFDVNNRAGFARYWPLSQWFETRGKAVVMTHGAHTPGKDKASAEIDWFIPVGTQWRRRHERIEEVCWSREEIEKTLTRTGFQNIRHWDASPFFPKGSVVEPGCRSNFLAHKPAV
jgi:SAM-dependent methyltransferase